MHFLFIALPSAVHFFKVWFSFFCCTFDAPCKKSFLFFRLSLLHSLYNYWEHAAFSWDYSVYDNLNFYNTGSFGRKPNWKDRDSPTQKWQNSISSNFDKLFCFASEVDRRRRSTEASSCGNSPRGAGLAVGLSSSSPSVSTTTTTIGNQGMKMELERPKTPSGSLECTTSPDSGIGKDLTSSLDIWAQNGSNQQVTNEITSSNLSHQLEKKPYNGISSNGFTMGMRPEEILSCPRTPSPSHVNELDDLDLDLPPVRIKMEVTAPPMCVDENDPVRHSKEPETVQIKLEKVDPSESSRQVQQAQPPQELLKTTATNNSEGSKHSSSTIESSVSQPSLVGTVKPQQQHSISSSNTSSVEQQPTKYFKKRWHIREESSGQTDGGRSSVASDCSSVASSNQEQHQSLSSSPAPSEILTSSKFRPKGKCWDWNSHPDGTGNHCVIQQQQKIPAQCESKAVPPATNPQPLLQQSPVSGAPAPSFTPIHNQTSTSVPQNLSRGVTSGNGNKGTFVPSASHQQHQQPVPRMSIGAGNGPINQHHHHHHQVPGQTNYYNYAVAPPKGGQAFQNSHAQHSHGQQSYPPHLNNIHPLNQQHMRHQPHPGGRYPQMQMHTQKLSHGGYGNTSGYNGNMDYSDHATVNNGYHQSSSRRMAEYGYYTSNQGGHTAYSNPQSHHHPRHNLHMQQNHAGHHHPQQNPNMYHHPNPSHVLPRR